MRWGSSLSEEQWVALKKESKTRRAWDKALYLLSLRDYARAQLQRKLEREAGSELARETVERLERRDCSTTGPTPADWPGIWWSAAISPAAALCRS